MSHIAEGFGGIITIPGQAVLGRPSWVDEFVRASEWREHGLDGELRALVRRGDLIPVGRGVHRWATAFAAAQARGEHPDDDRYRAIVRATGLTSSPDVTLSHESAALLHGLRSLAPWPFRASITGPASGASRTSRWLVRHAHAIDNDEVVVVDGLRATAAARTLVDIARSADRLSAFERLCAGLHKPRQGEALVTLEEICARLSSLDGARGVRAARALLRLASTGCESPAEARSLLLIHDLGFAQPQQQVEFRDAHGLMVADFFWPEAGLVGECDGLAKYLGDEGDGRAARRALIGEKQREGLLRALGLHVARWMPMTLRDPEAFRRLLLGAGAPGRRFTSKRRNGSAVST